MDGDRQRENWVHSTLLVRCVDFLRNHPTMGAGKRQAWEPSMRFGERIRELRKAKNMSLRALGEAVGVSFTYISKIENEKLDFGDYPSEDLIRKLAQALDADEDELLVL